MPSGLVLTPVLQGLRLLFSRGAGSLSSFGLCSFIQLGWRGRGWRWGEPVSPYPSFLCGSPDGEPGAASLSQTVSQNLGVVVLWMALVH